MPFHDGSLGTPGIGLRRNSLCQPSARNFTRELYDKNHRNYQKGKSRDRNAHGIHFVFRPFYETLYRH